MHPLRFFIFTLFSSITTFAAVFAEERTTTNNTNSSSSSFTFAVIPKNTNNEFFTVVEQGCLDQSALLSAPPSTSNVSCLYIGPPDLDPIAQAGYIDAIINGTYGKIDGISVSVSDAAIVGSAINRAIQAKIPTITFDSDAQDSLRRAAIGTNNTAFGVELGKVLEQLNPTGGKYGIIAAKAPNILDRVSGLREKLKETKWVEVESSWKDSNDDANTALQEMYEFVNEGDIDAIIPVGGWPMFNSDPQNWKNFVDSNRNLTLVVADTLSVQLDLMNQGYVNGLVGQLPYQMGVMSIDVLMKLVKGEEVDEEIFGTALLEVIQFPLNLPEYTVNNNYLGNLSIIAYVLVAVIEVAALAIMTWTYLHRKTRVIRASQPFFLYMVVIGVMVFASAMVFLAFDSGSGRFSQEMLDVSCMVVPWLTTLGFTTIFSALYAKLWRVNKIFHNPNAFKRVKITEKDVLKPYFVIMAMNIITLSCWTAIAPLTYQRFDYIGTDDWNRVIATYGVCSSQSAEENRDANAFLPYLVIIAIINIGILILANIQAYQARKIKTEYSESRYIAIIMASMLQAFALGVPCIFLLWQIPRAYFLVLVIVIFIISSVVLGLIFYPKMQFLKKWEIEQEEKQRKKEEMRNKLIVSKESSATDSEVGDEGLKVRISAKADFSRRSTVGGLKIAVVDSYKMDWMNETSRNPPDECQEKSDDNMADSGPEDASHEAAVEKDDDEVESDELKKDEGLKDVDVRDIKTLDEALDEIKRLQEQLSRRIQVVSESKAVEQEGMQGGVPSSRRISWKTD